MKRKIISISFNAQECAQLKELINSIYPLDCLVGFAFSESTAIKLILKDLHRKKVGNKRKKK